MSRYSVDTDDFVKALATIVRGMKVEDPSLGVFKCTTHEGDVITIRLKPPVVKWPPKPGQTCKCGCRNADGELRMCKKHQPHPLGSKS